MIGEIISGISDAVYACELLVEHPVAQGSMSAAARAAQRPLSVAGKESAAALLRRPAPAPAIAVAAIEKRFTLDANEALETRLRAACAAAVARLPEIAPPGEVEAFWLCGPYARGEGGFLATDQGDEAYSPMEFHLFLRAASGARAAAARKLAAGLSQEHGVEVTFTLHSAAAFRAQEPSVAHFEIASSHRCLLGDPRLLDEFAGHRDPFQLPLFEATRKLAAGVIGLLQARAVFAAAPAPAEDQRRECVRWLASVQLGLGDAVLIAFGQYHASCCERGQHIQYFPPHEQLPWLEEIQQHHAHGVLFQVHPLRRVPEAEELKESLASLGELALKVWLWLESRRLQQPFNSVLAYAACEVEKCPAPGGKGRWFSLFAAPEKRRAARLGKWLETVPLLLWQPGGVNEPKLLAFMQANLRTRARSRAELVSAAGEQWVQLQAEEAGG